VLMEHETQCAGMDAGAPGDTLVAAHAQRSGDGTIRRRERGHHRIAESEVLRLQLAPGIRKSVSSAAPFGSPRASRTGRSGQAGASKGVLVALSGRNQLRGIVDEVRSDGLLSQVRMRIGDQVLTAVITRDAVNELKLKKGDEAVAIIKSTEVMVGRTR